MKKIFITIVITGFIMITISCASNSNPYTEITPPPFSQIAIGPTQDDVQVTIVKKRIRKDKIIFSGSAEELGDLNVSRLSKKMKAGEFFHKNTYHITLEKEGYEPLVVEYAGGSIAWDTQVFNLLYGPFFPVAVLYDGIFGDFVIWAPPKILSGEGTVYGGSFTVDSITSLIVIEYPPITDVHNIPVNLDTEEDASTIESE